MKIINVLIGDDIRAEADSRNSIMGLYEDEITFITTPDRKKTWPKFKRLGILIRARLEKKDQNLKHFQAYFVYKKKKNLLAQGPFPTVNFGQLSNKIAFAIIHEKFEFLGLGIMKLEFHVFDENKNLIEKITPKFEFEIKEKNIN